ncbi:hypothetical protein [Dictyoglomus thermophilum]|uniref:Uncharacterized protein n=1 Tax=Dictyoglomus thermophilum (strain ATCC 35947 / DSM 3960 / H-6-12) TaxID=309799 RepID=B5YBL8_DICT6|nr:hypothetical protein [Dictyoglomus thermophilum]ACI19524.1 hypothetical protein DICTH_0201 [Dictyoglomus thermophilum H-6-12]
MKRLIKFLIVILFLTIIVFASTFKNKDYTGSNFPYKGALFLHDGDYVIFECAEGYNGFYYMTRKGETPVEVIDNNTGKQIGYLFLQENYYTTGESFDYAGFKWVDLQQGFKGKILKIVLRENRKIYNKTYGDRDLLIKFKSGTKIIYWHGVDLTDWCDLDYVAYY